MNLRMGGLFLLIAVKTFTKGQEDRKELHSTESDITGTSDGTKTRRSLTTFTRLGAAGVAVWRGIKATHILLKGATKLPQVNKVDKMYAKRGEYINALDDFYKVQPTDVRAFSGGMIGEIGDRVIKVIKGVSGYNPVLIISKIKHIENINPESPRFKVIVIEYRRS